MEFTKTNKIQIEDLMYILRKDPRKYARAKDLLIMNEELKRARKAFDEATKYWNAFHFLFFFWCLLFDLSNQILILKLNAVHLIVYFSRKKSAIYCIFGMIWLLHLEF